MELTAVLGEIAVSYASVTRYLRKPSFTGNSEASQIVEEKSSKILIQDAILSFLEDEPFASLRTIAKGTRIPKSTILYQLTYVMGWSIKHLRWIPHKLTDEQKQRRLEK